MHNFSHVQLLFGKLTIVEQHNTQQDAPLHFVVERWLDMRAKGEGFK